MKLFFLLLVFSLILFLIPISASAANWYVREGASGTSCADWNTACDQVSTALGQANRGDVIFVADGTYSGFNFNIPQSGSEWVTVQKATESIPGRSGSAHGTDAGWQSSYGDGQALFTGQVSIEAPYFHFDGVVGGGPGSWKLGHGFKVERSTGTLIDYSGAGTDAYVTLEHIELTTGSGWSSGDIGDAIFGTSGVMNHVIVSHIWAHEIPRVVLYHNDGSDVLLQYSYMENPCGQTIYDGTHCEHVVTRGLDDFIARYNIFKDQKSTGTLVNNLNTNERWQIYGNVFGQGNTGKTIRTDPGVTIPDYGCDYIVLNNDFLQHEIWTASICGSADDSYLYNNIFYHGFRNGEYWGVVSSAWDNIGYNYVTETYLDNSGTRQNFDSGPANTDTEYVSYGGKTRWWSVVRGSGSNPFSDWQNDDYSLSAELQGYPGYDVDSLSGITTGGFRNIAGDIIIDSYNIDMFGNVRGADGNWDRGAIEYQGSPPNTHYIRQGSSGDGSDWANTLGSLPSTLERGHTYYIADGSYGSYTFDDPESGTDYITIKKATESDHGTSVGWISDYGDGQAEFDGLLYSSGHYVLDGQKRNEDNWRDVESYGFRITDAIRIEPAVSYLIYEYVDVGGTPGSVYPNVISNGVAIQTSAGVDRTNLVFSRMHIHNVGIPFHSRHNSDVTLEYSHIGPGFNKEAISHQYGDNWIIRHNRFVDSCANPQAESCTAIIGVFNFCGTCDPTDVQSDNFEIYGNVFASIEHSENHNDAIIVGSHVNNWKVYNNNLINLGLRVDGISLSGGSNNVVYNTMWSPIGLYDQSGEYSAPVWCSATSCENLWCQQHEVIARSNRDCNNLRDTWPTTVVSSDDPFVDWQNFNFLLKDPAVFGDNSPVDAGKTLGAGFDDTDAFGNVRGADGFWDIGAYEYSDTGCSCDPWVDGNCQAGSCTTGQRQQTTTCTPSGCGPETRCISDPACDIACSTNQDCDDSNPCTDDSCLNPGTQSSSCQYTPNTNSCNDGNSCTTGDTCSSGSCSGTPITQCSLTSDSCCPSVCDETTDPDCSSICQNLVALYSFEGNAQDSSGNGNDGTPNTPTLSTSQTGYGEAYNFDGTDDYIDLGGLDIPGSELTISMWVNPDDFGVYDARLISKSTSSSEQDHYWMLSTFSNQVLRARLKTGGSTSTLIAPTGSIPAGTWSHAAFTYDGTEMKLYLNGQEVASQAKSGTLDTNPSVNAHIGQNPDGYGPFDGKIDDVAIFSRALTLSEIQDIHSAGQTLTCQSQPTYHPTDLDNSCTIELSELNSYINLWHLDSTTNPMNTLMESLAYYYSPSYC